MLWKTCAIPTLADWATVVMNARIDAVLEVLRELEASAVAPAVKVTSLCVGAYQSGIPPGVDVMSYSCSCRMHVPCVLEWMEDVVGRLEPPVCAVFA